MADSSKPPYGVWLFEDAKHSELQRVVGRLVASSTAVEKLSAEGATKFEDMAPAVARKGLPKRKGQRPAFILCIADADSPHHLLHTDENATPRPATLEDVLELERRWQQRLQEACKKAGAPAEVEVRTFLLRWAQESLVLAAPEALKRVAGGAGRESQLEALFQACTPRPDAAGTTALSFPDWKSCTSKIAKAVFNADKWAKDDNDRVLRALVDGLKDAAAVETLKTRHPDLERLSRLCAELEQVPGMAPAWSQP